MPRLSSTGTTSISGDSRPFPSHSRRHEESIMRRYLDIDLTNRAVSSREMHGEEIVKAGRYLIAKTLLDLGAATVDPLSPANPLIFSAGPFAGTSFSNANRTSVGRKSPLTGGHTEANGEGNTHSGMRRATSVETTE